jgi:hypothetical protein
MDLFGKKKKAAQKAQDEKKAASERPKSMPPRPMPKPEDNIKNKQAQNPNEERPKGASPRPPSKPEDRIAKTRDTAKLLKQKMDQSKGQQDPRKVEGDKYPRPPMSIKEKQGLDPKQRTNLPPDRPKPLVPKTEESKQYQDPKQRTNLPPERPKYLPPLTSPTSPNPKGNQYPPSPSPQEKGMDYGRPPGSRPMYPQEQQGQIK